ncbi:AbrB/MazE/SpoVT family DNA-binding domain-containing protein [Sphingomonas lenta]|uniref:AbrB family transcriptional regulator n=1 Tax=Sphingomonas lenta TaxID=1141887 RepID=A0A2A2SBG2_9SPHN|nr:AbrB/MazE/SpoVT family DNA-binding domain-containing protein [Sphingomonas lenta]PAX06361.1 AbrB family transcriptional regulator [Sphingomonas lenta]
MTITMDIRVAENGRMILPQSVRKAMGLQGEAKVILTLENDEVRLTPIGHGVARARALFRQHAKVERTTEQFLDDRREEAARDVGDATDASEGAGEKA